MRKDSELYVYEVCRSLKSCIEITPKIPKFEENDMVDVYDEKVREWTSGTVVGVTWRKVKKKLVLVSEVQLSTSLLLVQSSDLFQYLSKTSRSAPVTIPMYNRWGANALLLQFPKMVSLCSWWTFKQLVREVSLQARSFMTRYTKAKPSSMSGYVGVQAREGEEAELPFKVALIDASTNQCAVCCSEEGLAIGKECKGCDIRKLNGLVRDVKYLGNLAICLDWTDKKSYGLQEETEDVSVKSLKSNEQANPSLYNCLKAFFNSVPTAANPIEQSRQLTVRRVRQRAHIDSCFIDLKGSRHLDGKPALAVDPVSALRPARRLHWET